MFWYGRSFWILAGPTVRSMPLWVGLGSLALKESWIRQFV